MPRRDLPSVRRLVVKVGTSSLVDPDEGGESRSRMAKVARELAGSAAEGRACILVSSGAIAAGLGPLGMTRRPKQIAGLQAAAAAGQVRMVAEYARLFARYGLVAAQVLMTREDFVRRRQFVNAQHTFEQLLAAGAIPVVNENDTVATDEIRFGDNDTLAALVAVMVKADLLVILSDVDGIYTRDPGSTTAEFVDEITDPIAVRASGSRSKLGSGGMASKLEAARVATAAGVPTVVARASLRSVLSRVLDGDAVGTWIPARAGRKTARKAWMAFVMSPRGRIAVDAGAERALIERGTSLLAAGVTGVSGSFSAGDAVEIVGPADVPFARGMSNYSSAELPRIAGKSTSALAALSDGPYDREVVHRDELSLL